MTAENVVVGAFSGKHVLAELEDIDPVLLDDPDFLRDALVSALTEAGATICDVATHHFQPRGVTVLAMLAESHASVHTYPEIGAMFVDVFTCGDRADPEEAVRLFAAQLGTGSMTLASVPRGHRSKNARE